MPLQIEFEILPCELDVPFQGTPQVHVGIPHMNFGGPLFPKILRNNNLLIAKYFFFKDFLGLGDPQSSCGEFPGELWGSPERGPPIHMMNPQLTICSELALFCTYQKVESLNPSPNCIRYGWFWLPFQCVFFVGCLPSPRETCPGRRPCF